MVQIFNPYYMAPDLPFVQEDKDILIALAKLDMGQNQI